MSKSSLATFVHKLSLLCFTVLSTPVYSDESALIRSLDTPESQRVEVRAAEVYADVFSLTIVAKMPITVEYYGDIHGVQRIGAM